MRIYSSYFLLFPNLVTSPLKAWFQGIAAQEFGFFGHWVLLASNIDVTLSHYFVFFSRDSP
jgi:hypothetical protein